MNSDSDLGRLLAERDGQGGHLVSDEIARMIVVRILLEMHAIGVDIPSQVIGLVGAICADIGVTDDDPRPTLDAVLKEKAPGFVVRALDEILRGDDLDILKNAASIIGSATEQIGVRGPLPVAARPTSRLAGRPLVKKTNT